MVALSAQTRFRAARNAAGRSSHPIAARQPCLNSSGCHGEHVAHGPHPDRWSRRSRKPVPLRSGGWATNRDGLHRQRPRRASGRCSHTCSKFQNSPQAEGPAGELVGKVRTLRGQAARPGEIARLRAGAQQATPAGTGVADKPARIRQIECWVLPGNSNDLTGFPMTRPPGSHEETFAGLFLVRARNKRRARTLGLRITPPRQRPPRGCPPRCRSAAPRSAGCRLRTGKCAASARRSGHP